MTLAEKKEQEAKYHSMGVDPVFFKGQLDSPSAKDALNTAFYQMHKLLLIYVTINPSTLNEVHALIDTCGIYVEHILSVSLSMSEAKGFLGNIYRAIGLEIEESGIYLLSYHILLVLVCWCCG